MKVMLFSYPIIPVIHIFITKGGIKMKKIIILALIVFSSVIIFGWKPLEDYRSLEFVSYQITRIDYEGTSTITTTMSITRLEEDYEISTSNTWNHPLNDPIDMGIMFGQSMNFLFMSIMNPMYTFLYDAFDFDEMIPTKIMGFGTIRYEGTEKVGNYEGTKIVLYDDNKEPSMAWVINPDIPLALKTENYNNDQMIMILLDYKLAD